MQAGLALRGLSGAVASPKLIDLDVWSGSARRPPPRAPGCPAAPSDGSSSRGSRLRRHLARETRCRSPAARAPAPAAELVAANLRSAGIDVLQAGPLLRFTADGNRVTLFPDGRALVEGTEDTSKARAVVARWVGA